MGYDAEEDERYKAIRDSRRAERLRAAQAHILELTGEDHENVPNVFHDERYTHLANRLAETPVSKMDYHQGPSLRDYDRVHSKDRGEHQRENKIGVRFQREV